VWLYVPAEWQGLKGPIGIVFVAFVLTFPFRVLPAVLQGLQDLSFVGWAGIGSWATGTVVTVLLVIAHWGLYALAVGWVAAQLVSCVVWWLRLRRVFPKVLPDRLPSLPWRVARSFFARGTWLSMGQLSQLLLAGSDILVIGKLLGPVAVVPYSITGKLVYVLANQPHLLMHVAVPALSEVRASGDRQRTTNVMAALTEGMLVLSGLVVCVILVVNRGFVTWWVHSDQYAGDRLTAVLLLVMALRHWNATFTFTLFALGEERRLAFTGLGDGLVTIVMSIVLVRWMGLIGAPIGGLLGVALVALPFNLRGLAQQTNVSIAAILGRLVPWAWRFAVLVAAAIGLSRLWVPDRFFPLAIATSGVTAIYTLVMIPVVLRGPLAPYLHGRIPRRGQIVLQRLFGMTAA
jgi:O-antigen/teichoic acid export membrane protein